jgi:hypothetical protein
MYTAYWCSAMLCRTLPSDGLPAPLVAFRLFCPPQQMSWSLHLKGSLDFFTSLWMKTSMAYWPEDMCKGLSSLFPDTQGCTHLCFVSLLLHKSHLLLLLLIGFNRTVTVPVLPEDSPSLNCSSCASLVIPMHINTPFPVHYHLAWEPHHLSQWPSITSESRLNTPLPF